MLFFRKPSREVLQAFLDRQHVAPFSYSQLGCTAADPPAGFVCDYERTELGQGTQTFQAACEALRTWKMFDLGWTCVADPGCPLIAGQVVAVLARVGLVWMLNACRILEVYDEPGRRFGFTYGTLDDHAEQGEERFLIERDSSEVVWFDLRAVSRPHLWYVRLFRPLARLFQRRFRRGASLAMLRATQPVANRAKN
jgi:uncharacterized protein (UPF0548 family)